MFFVSLASESFRIFVFGFVFHTSMFARFSQCFRG